MNLDILANYAEVRHGTVYVVTGYQRSFTSVMMRALEAGGMDALYHKSRDAWAQKEAVDPNYNPNKDGLYELDAPTRNRFFITPASFDGKLVKILSNYGRFDPTMYFGSYKVAVMLREPEEIRESHKRFFGDYPVYRDGKVELPLTDDLYLQLMIHTLRACRNRRDIDYLTVKGSELIQEPLTVFHRMRLAGWPVDAEKAATVVDPAQYRNRKEEAVVSR